MRASLVLWTMLSVVGVAGCRSAAPGPSAQAGPSPLPPLEIVLTDSVRIRDPRAAGPHVPGSEPRLVTLTAANADVRVLLLTLAEAAGVSLVFGPEVQGRVSVQFDSVPAPLALQTVLEQAGLSVAAGPAKAPWGPTEFYVLPVNVNEASEEMLRVRFGISPEVARWIVENRRRP